MSIAAPGWRYILIGLVLAAFGGVAALKYRFWIGWVPWTLGLIFSAFCCYFFRDPERPLPTDATLIYAPGDGVVMSVMKEEGSSAVTMRMFLSVWDVHIQRSPAAGRVEKVDRLEGTYVHAGKPGSQRNHRSVVTLRPEGREPLVVEQIAGLIARRIETWPKPGDALKAGERYGLIHFGSQAAVHFPNSAECTVKPGERLAAGLSPIGRWK